MQLKMNANTQQPLPSRKQTENFVKQTQKAQNASKQRHPEVWDYEHNWKSTICQDFKPSKKCCCSVWCFWCFVCELQSRTGECFCTPFVPGAMVGLRSKIRTGFRIRGSLLEDFMITTFCPFCAALQLQHELDVQGL